MVRVLTIECLSGARDGLAFCAKTRFTMCTDATGTDMVQLCASVCKGGFNLKSQLQSGVHVTCRVA